VPDSPNPGQSYEAWIESKAGACPPDEFKIALIDGMLVRVVRDWPFDPDAPTTPPDDEALEVPNDSQT
jgi:hypothetical protein